MIIEVLQSPPGLILKSVISLYYINYILYRFRFLCYISSLLTIVLQHSDLMYLHAVNEVEEKHRKLEVR